MAAICINIPIINPTSSRSSLKPRPFVPSIYSNRNRNLPVPVICRASPKATSREQDRLPSPTSWLSEKTLGGQTPRLYTFMKYKISTQASTVEDATGVTENGSFSLTDAQLAGRGFQLASGTQGLDLEQLNSLFAKVGFPRREEKKLRTALEHTMASQWVTRVETGRLVAFARATGDAVFNAVIWDVVVDPEFQGSGLGKVVMERLMAILLEQGICNIALYAEPNVVGFYRPMGFVTDPDGIRGMAFRKKR